MIHYSRYLDERLECVNIHEVIESLHLFPNLMALMLSTLAYVYDRARDLFLYDLLQDVHVRVHVHAPLLHLHFRKNYTSTSNHQSEPS